MATGFTTGFIAGFTTKNGHLKDYIFLKDHFATLPAFKTAFEMTRSKILLLLVMICHICTSVIAVAVLKGFVDRFSRVLLPNISAKKSLSIPPTKVPTGMTFDIMTYILKISDEIHAVKRYPDLAATVKYLDNKLKRIVEYGATKEQAAILILEFFEDPEKIVQTSIKEKAFTLLKMLQMVFIWRDEHQFYLFKALSFLSPWFDSKMWWDTKYFPMAWRRNIRAICQLDKDVLVPIMMRECMVYPLKFYEYEEAMLHCATYDAIKVFRKIRLNPAELRNYLEIMAVNGSAKLLQLYQTISKVKHLHLERFALPKNLPVNEEVLDFYMKNGYNYLRVGRFIKRACRENRLDLLKYLHKERPDFVISDSNLKIVAKRGWFEILQWAYKVRPFSDYVLSDMAALLANHLHLEALDWLINETSAFTEDSIARYSVIDDIIVAGTLKALCFIDEKRPIKEAKASWADLAVKNCHLPVLKWLNKRFRLFPAAKSLQYANADILRWISTKDRSMISLRLIRDGTSNLALLQYLYKDNMAYFNEISITLARKVKSMDMMLWLNDNLKVCPADIDWAYVAGDLKAIKWALENCKIFPTLDNATLAAKGGHYNIIKWIFKNFIELLRTPSILMAAVQHGQLEIADYLITRFVPEDLIYLAISNELSLDQCLNILKWLHKHEPIFDMSFLPERMKLAVRDGHLPTISWIVKTFPDMQLPVEVWGIAARLGYSDVYRWLLNNHSKGRASEYFKQDLSEAIIKGHLEIEQMIRNRAKLNY